MSASTRLPDNEFYSPPNPAVDAPTILYRESDPTWSSRLHRIPTDSRALPIVFHKEMLDTILDNYPLEQNDWRLPTNYFGKAGTALRLPRVACFRGFSTTVLDYIVSSVSQAALDAKHVHVANFTLQGVLNEASTSGAIGNGTMGMPWASELSVESQGQDYASPTIDQGAWVGGHYFHAAINGGAGSGYFYDGSFDVLNEVLAAYLAAWEDGFANFQRVKIVLVNWQGDITDPNQVTAQDNVFAQITAAGFAEVEVMNDTFLDGEATLTDAVLQSAFDTLFRSRMIEFFEL